MRPHPCLPERAARRRRALGTGLTLLLPLVMVTVSSRPGGATVQVRARPPARSGPFAWLSAATAPPGWALAVLPSGEAQVSYPPTFAPVAGDRGTVSAAMRDAHGTFLAYVNVTPRQGDERLQGFGPFRVGLLRHEDPTVVQDATEEGLLFHGGRGSCVIDHYVTRIEHNRYREVACLAQGRRGSAVVVAAAMEPLWKQLFPMLRRVVASFTVR